MMFSSLVIDDSQRNKLKASKLMSLNRGTNSIRTKDPSGELLWMNKVPIQKWLEANRITISPKHPLPVVRPFANEARTMDYGHPSWNLHCKVLAKVSRYRNESNVAVKEGVEAIDSL